MLSPNDIVLKVAAALDRAGIPFMIVGSFSSNVYGIERNTQDADFVVQMQAESLGKLVAQLGADFKLDPQVSFESIVSMGQFYVIKHLHPFFKIELFISGDDSFSVQQFKRRRTARLAGQSLNFISPEDLIVTKLRWFLADKRRTKDKDDVRGVLAVQRGRLDIDYVRHWCGQQGTLELLEEQLRTIPPEPRT